MQYHAFKEKKILFEVNQPTEKKKNPGFAKPILFFARGCRVAKMSLGEFLITSFQDSLAGFKTFLDVVITRKKGFMSSLEAQSSCAPCDPFILSARQPVFSDTGLSTPSCWRFSWHHIAFISGLKTVRFSELTVHLQ